MWFGECFAAWLRVQFDARPIGSVRRDQTRGPTVHPELLDLDGVPRFGQHHGSRGPGARFIRADVQSGQTVQQPQKKTTQIREKRARLGLLGPAVRSVFVRLHEPVVNELAIAGIEQV